SCGGDRQIGRRLASLRWPARGARNLLAEQPPTLGRLRSPGRPPQVYSDIGRARLARRDAVVDPNASSLIFDTEWAPATITSHSMLRACSVMILAGSSPRMLVFLARRPCLE